MIEQIEENKYWIQFTLSFGNINGDVVKKGKPWKEKFRRRRRVINALIKW